MGEVVFKLTAPSGKIFRGVRVEPTGKCTIDESVGENRSTAFTVFGGDTAAELGVAVRAKSFTDSNAAATSAGDLPTVTVKGNNKSEMYLSVRLNGGEYGMTYLSSLKVTGIFSDSYTVDSVTFSGNGEFPTDGTLTAMYNISSPETGQTLPEKLTFILAVYKESDDGSVTLVDVETSEQENPEAGAAYSVTITGLPEADTDGYSAKAFVWDSIGGMIPESNAFEL